MKNLQKSPKFFFALLLVGLALSGANNCGSDAAPPAPSPDTSLAVSVTGVGSGTVTSDVGDIDCTKDGGNCEALLFAGTTVTLTASPDQGFFFNGWLGDSCQGIGPCTLDLNQDETVQASFVNVAFYSNRSLDPNQDAPNSQEVANVWLVNSDGSNPHSVAGLEAALARSFLPSFSPDGNQILFLSARNLDGMPSATVNDVLNVWVMGADGSNPKPLAGFDLAGVTVGFDNPLWSPDGSKILFVSNRNINGSPTPNSNGHYNVWIMNADGSDPKALAGLDVAGVHSGLPDWSPDGSKIAFESTRNIDLSPTVSPNGVFNLFVVDADGSDLQPITRITLTDGHARFPQWSPDGTRLAFQSNRSLGNDENGPLELDSNIWVAQADASSFLALTEDTGGAYNRFPRWAPDESLIAFESSQDPINPNASGPGLAGFVGNVWAVVPDGGQAAFPLTALTEAGNFVSFPYFAPDASAVIYDSTRNLDPTLQAPPSSAINLWIVKPDGSGDLPLTDLTHPLVYNFSAVNLD